VRSVKEHLYIAYCVCFTGTLRIVCALLGRYVLGAAQQTLSRRVGAIGSPSEEDTQVSVFRVKIILARN
jgi:hypothetical protein